MTVRSTRGARVTGALASVLLAVGLAAGCGGGEPGGEKTEQVAGTRPRAGVPPSVAGSPETAQHEKEKHRKRQDEKGTYGERERARAQAKAGPGSAPSASAAPRERQSAEPAGPKVPAAELTPATGTFAAKEREYLKNRVPRGVDPAAVLVSGKDTCQRITRTAEVDRDVAVDAIRSGEIADAEAAITHLCPQHQELLREAQG